MGKYNKYERKMPEARYKIAPVWTGIGCIMLLIVPVMSWAGAVEFIVLARAQNWPILNGLTGPAVLPAIFYNTPFLSSIAGFISSIPDFYATLLYFFVLLLAFSGALSLVYAVVYRVIGPARYSPMDAPAERIKVKRYTR